MKKEVLIAIIAGLVLGLVITMGIYTANRSLNQQRAKKLMQNTPAPTTMPGNFSNKTLNITSHESFDLMDTSALTLSGIAWPNAVVALISEADSQITRADAEGIFIFETRLIKGFNEIAVIASDETGATQTQNLVLTYSTNKIEPETSLLNLVKTAYAAEAEATSGAETVTEKIKERLQDTVSEGLVAIKEEITGKLAAPRKKAYVGKIGSLDATNLTLAYKEQNFSVNLNDKTIFVKGANTAIDWEDLDVDNFVIAMGFYHSDSDSFTAARVSLISEPEPPVNQQLVQGKISEVDGQKVSLNGKTLTLGKKTDLTISGVDKPAAEDLALGDNLFAIATLDNNGDIDSVDAVYVVPGKNNPAGLTPTNLNSTNSAEASPSAEDAQ